MAFGTPITIVSSTTVTYSVGLELPDGNYFVGRSTLTDIHFDIINPDGTVVKLAGTTNTAELDTLGNLCCYLDGGDGEVKIRNRLSATLEMTIHYNYGV